MTETEWLACKDPVAMMNRLYRRASDRKARLFTCACLHMLKARPWLLRLENEIWEIVGVAEGYADGLVTEQKRNAALRRTAKWLRSHSDEFSTAARLTLTKDAWTVTTAVVNSIAVDFSGLGYESERDELLGRAHASLAAVVRECFGSLHSAPVTFDPAWRTPDVLLLAQGIYDTKALDRMPTLATALQSAGCTNTDVLNHYRDSQPVHVRGCWALDLVLGKE